MEKEFDENDAVKFIRDHVPENLKNKYDDDDIFARYRHGI
jgi:hypothetical protein